MNSPEADVFLDFPWVNDVYEILGDKSNEYKIGGGSMYLRREWRRGV